MFSILAIAICALSLFNSYYLGWGLSYGVSQAELALLVVMALFSDSSQRHKSVLAIFTIWFVYIFATDWAIGYVPPVLNGFEANALSIAVLWALLRPYYYQSAELIGENVFIGFYQGTHAPFLSSLAALFGLPFPSVAIIAGDTVLRASGSGKMVINNSSVVRGGDFLLIDTGVMATEKIFEEIAKCSGKPTKALGVFRTKCIKNCEPVLEMLGLKPKSFFYYMPSIFYYQVTGECHGVRT